MGCDSSNAVKEKDNEEKIEKINKNSLENEENYNNENKNKSSQENPKNINGDNNNSNINKDINGNTNIEIKSISNDEENEEKKKKKKKNEEEDPRRKKILEMYLKRHGDEIDEVYTKQKSSGIDLDVNAIVLQKREKEKYEAMLKKIKEDERKKWLELHQKFLDKALKKRKEWYTEFINKNPKLIRILILGELKSGKTNFITKYASDIFEENYETTYETYSIIGENHVYADTIFHTEIVDTPPYNDFQHNRKFDDELCKSNIIIFVYDCSSQKGLERVKEFILKLNFYEDQTWGIVATKNDLLIGDKEYQQFELDDFCNFFGMVNLFISAKNDDQRLFRAFFQNIFDNHMRILNKEKN